MDCNFTNVMKKATEALSKEYTGYALDLATRDAEMQLVAANPKVAPIEAILGDFEPTGKIALKNYEKAQIIQGKSKPTITESIWLARAREAAYNEMVGNGIDGNGRFTTAKERYQMKGLAAAKRNADTVLGSSENVSWSEQALKPGEHIELKSLLNDFEDQLDVMLNDVVDDAHFYALKDTFNASVKIFQDAGLEVNYEYLQRSGLQNGESEGSADLDKDQIQIRMGNRSDFFQPAELLLHEMQHLLVDRVLRNNDRFKRKIRKLRMSVKADPNIDYRIFLTDKPNATQDQIDYAKKHFDYVFNNKTGSIEGEFLVAATTNKYVINAIAQHKPAMTILDEFDANKAMAQNVKLGKGNRRGKTLKTIAMEIVNILIGLINQAYNDMKKMTGRTGLGLAEDMLTELSRSAVASERGTKVKPMSSNAILKMFRTAENKLTKMAKRINTNYDDIEKYGKKLRTKEGVVGFIDKLTNHGRLLKMKNNLIINGWFNGMMRDTADASVAWFYEMVRVSKKDIDKKVNEVKNTVRSNFEKEYGWGDLADNDGLRVASTNLLIRTDLKAIGGLKELEMYLDDPKALMKEINRLKRGMSDEAETYSARLAYKLMHGIELGANGYKNAIEIYKATKELEGNTSKTLEKDIDQLITLRAIQLAGKADKTVVGEALKDPKKVEMMQMALNVYNEKTKHSLETLYLNNEVNMTKGQFIADFKDNVTMTLASEEDLPSLAKMRIFPIDIDKPIPELYAATGSKYYMVSGPNLEADYARGLISTIQLTPEGQSLKAMLYKLGWSLDDVDGVINKFAARPLEKSLSSVHERHMSAERDMQGKIIDYRFVPTVQEQYDKMGLNNDIVQVLANTVSNITNKEISIESNIGAINAMEDFYEKNKKEFGDEFVKVRPSSKIELDAGKPYKYAYLWDVLPGYTQKLLAQKTHGDGYLFVHNTMVQDFFGFKEASIVNAPLINKSHATRVGAKVIEDLVKMFIGRFKKVVVTLYVDTIKGNLTSNAYVTMMETKMNPIEYSKKFQNAWEELNLYHERAKIMAKMDVDKLAGLPFDEAVYNSLLVENKNSSVSDVIKDGQYTQILEDLDLSRENSESFTKKQVKKMIDKLPESLVTTKNLLYLDDHTAAYQKIVKLTQYGDVINRIVIYNALKGTMKKRPLLNMLDQLFVNYSYLDNKYIKWGNDTGPLLFTKYTTRTMIAVWKIITRNPLTTLLFTGGQKLTGIDLDDIYDSYFSFWDTITHKFAYGDVKNLFQAVFIPAWVP